MDINLYLSGRASGKAAPAVNHQAISLAWGLLYLPASYRILLFKFLIFGSVHGHYIESLKSISVSLGLWSITVTGVTLDGCSLAARGVSSRVCAQHLELGQWQWQRHREGRQWMVGTEARWTSVPPEDKSWVTDTRSFGEAGTSHIEASEIQVCTRLSCRPRTRGLRSLL